MTNYALETRLGEYLTRALPLGPEITERIEDPSVVEAIFDSSSELERRIRNESPTYLIGRKGSGKTAFLRAVNETGGVVIELSAPDILGIMSRTLAALQEANEPLFVEDVALIWDAVFVASLSGYVAQGKCQLPAELLPRTLRFGETKLKTVKAHSVAADLMKLFRARIARPGADWTSLDALTDSLIRNGTRLDFVQQELAASVRKAKCEIWFHIDSVEEYGSEPDQTGMRDLALRGLFFHAGKLLAPNRPLYRVRICIPAEMWYALYDLSANPLKDFQNSVILHWNARELVHLASSRLLRYLVINFPRLANIIGSNEGQLNQWRWSQRFLRQFLPERITNDFGAAEDTLPYLLRHTQLQPRHFLHIMNNVFAEHEFTPTNLRVAHERVKAGVKEAEATIVTTIVKSYKARFPDLQRVCEAIIPKVSLTFEYGELHSSRNEGAIKSVGSFNDVLRMMVECGAVGRVTSETENYVEGEFEYLSTHKLLFTERQTVPTPDIC